MLEFDGEWRYDTPGAIEPKVLSSFRELIEKICRQGQRRVLLEHFKSYFASAAGVAYYRSSNESWASTDLDRLISGAAINAPLFIEAFYDACEVLGKRFPEMQMPSIARINRILSDASAIYFIDPPKLVAKSSNVTILIPENLPSINARVKATIEDSLQASERALDEGKGRQAVQEILWLLETVSTIFRGEEVLNHKITGQYFNKIVRELKTHTTDNQKQILQWIQQLYGHLSSPTRGGVRHGTDIKEGLGLGIDEARLYCNLIRSYMTFLISEYERLQR